MIKQETYEKICILLIGVVIGTTMTLKRVGF